LISLFSFCAKEKKMKKRWTIVTLLSLLVIALGATLPANKSGATTITSPRAPEPITGTTVTISNFMFSPRVVRIKAGAEVTWSVKEGTHTVSGDTGGWESPTLSAGKSFSHQFTTAGTYGYHCSFHGSAGHDMYGSVIVTK
jgi:plastocyanin